MALNGGITQTHSLVTGSPAIDASPDNADCQDFDQRGVPRPQGVECDIGAYESTVCGDGIVAGEEQCDDNNTQDGDCCSSLCQEEDLGQTSCGVGACFVTADQCLAGVPQTCIPDMPGAETCNSIDDDCDGAVDEDNVCAPPLVHDLAVTAITAPATVTLTHAKPQQTKQVKVKIQNRSPHNETIQNQMVLGDLMSLTLEPLTLGICVPMVSLSAKQISLPKVLKPKEQFTVNFDVTFACALDPAKSTPQNPNHDDFRYRATVNHAAIDGQPDTHADDDECPRGALEIDPYPDGTINDKGCAEEITDVIDKR